MPGLGADSIWCDAGGDVGERRAYGGCGCGAGELGHRGAYFAAYGADRANRAGEGES